jgi:hypothetical protein
VQILHAPDEDDLPEKRWLWRNRNDGPWSIFGLLFTTELNGTIFDLIVMATAVSRDSSYTRIHPVRSLRRRISTSSDALRSLAKDPGTRKRELYLAAVLFQTRLENQVVFFDSFCLLFFYSFLGAKRCSTYRSL